MDREVRSSLDMITSAVAIAQIECPDRDSLSSASTQEEHIVENGTQPMQEPLDAVDGVVDVKPQVSRQLDILNQRNEAINKLEIEYEEQMHVYSVMVNEANGELNKIENKLGDCVRTAFSYYNALDDLYAAKNQLRDALSRFETAQSIYLNVNEFIDRIEHARLEYDIGDVWIQVLDKAKKKAEYFGKEKVLVDEDVQKWSSAVVAIEKDAKEFEKGNTRQIRKARPFYDRRFELRRVLNNQVTLLNQMKDCIAEAKSEYQSALRQLELISNRIHKHRHDSNMKEIEDQQNGSGTDVEL